MRLGQGDGRPCGGLPGEEANLRNTTAALVYENRRRHANRTPPGYSGDPGAGDIPGRTAFPAHTRKVQLTFEGEQFYERVKEILSNVAEPTSMFGHSGTTLRGRLRIDIPTAFAQSGFIENLRDFSALYPEIELTLGVTDRAVDLVTEGVDCVLRIGQATMVTCASPGYLHEYDEPKTLKELSAHRGVTFLSGQNNRALPWQFSDDGNDQTYIQAALPFSARRVSIA